MDALEGLLDRLLGRVCGLRAQHLGDLIADPQRRVQRGGRVLWHVRDEPAAAGADLALGQAGHFLAAQPDRAARDPRAGPRVAEQGERDAIAAINRGGLPLPGT
jgi:hypothetical protein